MLRAGLGEWQLFSLVLAEVGLQIDKTLYESDQEVHIHTDQVSIVFDPDLPR